jgi:hypothetical protein
MHTDRWALAEYQNVEVNFVYYATVLESLVIGKITFAITFCLAGT